MRLYRIYDPAEGKVTVKRTLDAAKGVVNVAEPVFRSTFSVTLCEVPTDAAGIERLVNEGFDAVATPLRRWNGTHRGGLKEVDIAGGAG